MNLGKFQIFTGSGGKYYFRLKSRGNFEPILTSTEGYNSKESCQNGIESVRTNSQFDARYNKKVANDGKYYFTLLAANHEPIGKSETYPTTQARDNGIEAVKRDAPSATVEDLTLSKVY